MATQTLTDIIGTALIGADVNQIAARALPARAKTMARTCDAAAKRRAAQAYRFEHADARLRGASSACFTARLCAVRHREAAQWWTALAGALRSL